MILINRVYSPAKVVTVLLKTYSFRQIENLVHFVPAIMAEVYINELLC